MHCALYDAGRCRSCQWLERPVPQQLADKMADLRTLLAAIPVAAWGRGRSAGQRRPFVTRPRWWSAAALSVRCWGCCIAMAPRWISPTARSIPPSLRRCFAVLKPFIARAGLTPYNVARKRGELKYLLLTASQHGEMMLRFVLRSEAKVAQLRAALPWLQAQLPQLKVITANIQPVHMAIMEGEQEIFFTEQQALGEVFNEVPLWIRPQSFFQTNPAVASRLYATARDWVRALPVQHMWDLFLRRRGFGLHCATPAMRLTGIEIAPEAIACARQSAAQLGLSNLAFSGAGLDAVRHS